MRISWLTNDHGLSGISWLSMGSFGAWLAYWAHTGHDMHLFLTSEVMPGQKRDTLALWMHEPAPKCVLWIFSSIAGLIELGITACWPLYTMPSATESSSLKVKYGRTKWSTPVLAVGQPVIMRRDSFCSAGSIAVCSRKFFWVTLEIPELSKAIVSNSTQKMCSPERFAVWRAVEEELLTGCRLWLVVLLSCSSLQMTIVGVSCAWLVDAVVLCWEVSWRYSPVADDPFVQWYLTFYKADCPICQKLSILQDIPFR